VETSGGIIILRSFNIEDYNEYASWWDPEAPPEVSNLPDFGIVYGDMKAIGFLANTDCDIGIITFWHCNPKNKAIESYKALKALVIALCEAAALMGKSKVFCYTNKRGMIRLLESLNFINHEGHLIVEVI